MTFSGRGHEHRDPKRADQQVKKVGQKRGLLAFVGVADELQDPAGDEESENAGAVGEADEDGCEFQHKAARYSDLIAATVPI